MFIFIMDTGGVVAWLVIQITTSAESFTLRANVAELYTVNISMAYKCDIFTYFQCF